MQSENILVAFVTLDISKFDKSKYFSLEHFWNIHIVFVADNVLKFFKFISSKFTHPSNIPFIRRTLDVSNEDKSKYFNDWQSLNIYGVLPTIEVLKLDKFIDVNLIQPINIDLIIVTDDVLKLSKFKYLIALQYSNNLSIFTTLEVSKFDKSIEANFSHP